MNLFELFVEIGVKDKASKALSSISSKLGNGLKTAAKIGTTAMAAAASGIAALATASINNYAEYEQLVGGVETLFGNSAKKVQEYAMQAYQSAGLSANEYMNTVTSFSASLLQSLGGDTEKAAEYADRAIRDMADNANKMGTDISMIQNAYQGFAKQNYTMLDNLKLGYGGTKTEMARLVKDAAALTDVQKELGIVVNENDASFGNIVNAISVVQKSMGIMGTTAKEASSTIQGSISSMKSAWANLSTGLSDETADMDSLVDNFVESVGTVADNLIPRIEIALSGIGKLVENLAPVIAESLPKLIASVAPSLLGAAKELVLTIGKSIMNNADKILDFGAQILNNLMKGITKNAPKISKTIKDFVGKIGNFITENLPILLENASEMVVALGEGIADSLDEIIPALTDMIVFIAKKLSDPNFLIPIGKTAIKIIGSITNGLINAAGDIAKALPFIIRGLADSIPEWVDDIAQLGVDLMGSLLSNVPEIVASILESVPAILMGVVEGVFSIGTYLKDNLVGTLGNANTSGGISKNYDKLQNMLDDKADDFVRDYKFEYDGQGGKLDQYNTTMNGVNINIYPGTTEDSAEDIANYVAEVMQDLVDRRSAVYGR